VEEREWRQAASKGTVKAKKEDKENLRTGAERKKQHRQNRKTAGKPSAILLTREQSCIKKELQKKSKSCFQQLERKKIAKANSKEKRTSNLRSPILSTYADKNKFIQVRNGL
jgi:hypothetical protein